ncbi:hypothetical protein GXW82_35520 [Streptacidiphilus sp. 4-A2]|nr:hypothetical protein [Streptacidiphilus sp. 4-A2]
MPSVLGVLERRERVALARAEELRAELERLQAAVAEADEAARRAVIAREETVVALAEAAEEAVVVGVPVNLPAAGVAGPRVEVPLWCEGVGSRCCRPSARGSWPWSRRMPPVAGTECGHGRCASIWAGQPVMRGSRQRGFGRSGWSSGAG